MNKIVVSFSVIFCALHWTFGGPMSDGNYFDLNDQDLEQEAQNLARFQEAVKKSLPSIEEARLPYVLQKEMVEKDSLFNGARAVNDLDGNRNVLTTSKPKKGGKDDCSWCLWCCKRQLRQL